MKDIMSDELAAPKIVDRSTFHAELDALRVRVQQRVRLLAGTLDYIIGCVQVHRIDFGGDLIVAPSRGNCAERWRPVRRLPRRHSGRAHIRSDQLGAGDGPVLSLAVEDVLDAPVIALMELMEVDGLGAGGDTELDRQRDHAKRDMALPNTGCHG